MPWFLENSKNLCGPETLVNEVENEIRYTFYT